MAINLEFENKLWEMADKLRGNIQPSDYKDVVLGLIFLKYISDSFEEKYKEEIKEYKDILGFCKSALIEEVREHEYILTPGRYVGIENFEEDSELFDEKMTRLTTELAEMFAKAHKLEEEIKERLGEIGYGF